MSAPRLKHFGWGREGEGLTAEEEAFVLARAEARFGTALQVSASAPQLNEIELAAPRVTAPASLSFCTSEHYDRAAHTYGKSYPELARGLARDYANAPDVVAYPRNEREVANRKSTRLNSSHLVSSYAVLCLKKKQVCPPYPGVRVLSVQLHA